MKTEFLSNQVRWLLDEWSGLIPDVFKILFLGQSGAQMLEIDPNIDSVARRDRSWVVPTSFVLGKAAEVLPYRTVVDVALPVNFLLERQIVAPKSAIRKIKPLAELDLRHRTPLDLADVYWTLSKPKICKDSSISVVQWVARKHDLHGWVEALESYGFVVRRLLVGSPNAFDPIADFSNSVTPRGAIWRKLNLTFGGLAAFLALMLWLLPGWYAARDVRSQSKIVEDLRQQAIRIRRDVEDQRAQKKERAELTDYVFNRTTLSDALRELSVALPDDTWIGELRFKGDSVIISGQTRGSAADLVLTLSRKSDFANPRLSGKTARTAGGAEIFELTLDLARVDQ